MRAPEMEQRITGCLSSEETSRFRGLVISDQIDSRKDESEGLLRAEPDTDIENLKIGMSRSSCQVRSFS